MYVADLENELIHHIQENQKIKADAEVEMTVIVGSKEALTSIKYDLESQVEELVHDNCIKEQKLQ